MFLGLATVAGMFFGQMDISQAAETGVQALAAGQNTATVDSLVAATLAREGYQGAAPTTSAMVQGSTSTVTVSVPFTLWNTGAATQLTAARSLAAPPSPAAPSGGTPVTSSGSGGGGGGGRYVYHHFPMW